MSLLVTSCKGKPSDEQISKKVLMEYTCAETAKVISLQVVNSAETKTIMGGKALEYTVSGAVQWPKGCTEFGTGVSPGYTENFVNKRIFFAKTDEGWQ